MKNSDRVKKISLSLSVILAMILFFCLYLINLSRNSKEDNISQDSEPVMVTTTSIKSTELKGNKSIYSRYNPAGFSKVYINVFSSRDEEGNTINFSDFDLLADWDRDFNPILDAYVQFADKENQPKEQRIYMPNASIRVRGNPGASLKSYRVKLVDGIDGINGQSVFNLDKQLNDPSRIANKLAHDLIIDLKHITGFRTEFLEVYIRDDSIEEDESFNSYGLYTHIEQPNKTYLRSRGLDEKGSLYRAVDFNFQLAPGLKNANDPEYDEQAFETVLSIREGNDHTKLIQMLKDINDESKDFIEVFNTYFNEDNYLTWLSINILLGNVDAMSEGFLLYSPSNSSGFYFLPWDFEGIFQWMDDKSDLANIYDAIEDVDLHRKYLQVDGNLEKLKVRIEELKSDTFSKDKVKYLIKQYKPILLEMMNQYPDNVLLSIPLNEQIAYLGQIDKKILLNYYDFIKYYEQY
ncbi:MAG: hypothetical protein EWM47_08680 [Anaerolineaceae bacterium]|nr:MAG: hypothetical protein EWM47_08680 [Anaerolineaceae bacterium]